MGAPMFPVASSTITEYCAFASFAAFAVIASHARGTEHKRKSGSERSFVVGRFLFYGDPRVLPLLRFGDRPVAKNSTAVALPMECPLGCGATVRSNRENPRQIRAG
jgi:hypothetical protein